MGNLGYQTNSRILVILQNLILNKVRKPLRPELGMVPCSSLLKIDFKSIICCFILLNLRTLDLKPLSSKWFNLYFCLIKVKQLFFA